MFRKNLPLALVTLVIVFSMLLSACGKPAEEAKALSVGIVLPTKDELRLI